MYIDHGDVVSLIVVIRMYPEHVVYVYSVCICVCLCMHVYSCMYVSSFQITQVDMYITYEDEYICIVTSMHTLLCCCFRSIQVLRRKNEISIKQLVHVTCFVICHFPFRFLSMTLNVVEILCIHI